MTLVVGGVAAADILTTAARHESVTDLIQPPLSDASEEQHEQFAAFTEAMAVKLFSEAEISAKQMINLVRASEYANPIDAVFARAGALQNLAIAQQSGGNHQAAKQNYITALDTISAATDNLSPALIPLLRGLAIAYQDTGQPQEAIAAYERAMHISSVNFGLHNLNQLPIVHSKMQFFLERDDRASALDMLDQTFMLYSRLYPPRSEELLPVFYQQADLYRDLGMNYEERNALQQILLIKQMHHAENDPALVEPNIRIAKNLMRVLLKNNYRLVSTSDAERHLKKALWIAENSDEDQWEIRKDCLLSLADFYTIFDMKGRARRYYRDAWDLLSSPESGPDLRSEELEAPVRLARPALNPVADFDYNPDREKVAPNDYLEGEIVVAFTVNDRGRTEDPRLVTANPENFTEMETRLRNAVKEFVYRPRLVDGKVVATPDLEYRFVYRYTPSEYQAALEKAPRPRSPWQAKKH